MNIDGLVAYIRKRQQEVPYLYVMEPAFIKELRDELGVSIFEARGACRRVQLLDEAGSATEFNELKVVLQSVIEEVVR